MIRFRSERGLPCEFPFVPTAGCVILSLSLVLSLSRSSFSGNVALPPYPPLPVSHTATALHRGQHHLIQRGHRCDATRRRVPVQHRARAGPSREAHSTGFRSLALSPPPSLHSHIPLLHFVAFTACQPHLISLTTSSPQAHTYIHPSLAQFAFAFILPCPSLYIGDATKRQECDPNTEEEVVEEEEEEDFITNGNWRGKQHSLPRRPSTTF